MGFTKWNITLRPQLSPLICKEIESFEIPFAKKKLIHKTMSWNLNVYDVGENNIKQITSYKQNKYLLYLPWDLNNLNANLFFKMTASMLDQLLLSYSSPVPKAFLCQELNHFYDVFE